MKDLTTVKGSYVYALVEHQAEIDAAYAAGSLSAFKQKVREIILSANNKPLEEKSYDTKKFLLALDRSPDLDKALFLVYNTINCGGGMGLCKTDRKYRNK